VHRDAAQHHSDALVELNAGGVPGSGLHLSSAAHAAGDHADDADRDEWDARRAHHQKEAERHEGYAKVSKTKSRARAHIQAAQAHDEAARVHGRSIDTAHHHAVTRHAFRQSRLAEPTAHGALRERHEDLKDRARALGEWGGTHEEDLNRHDPQNFTHDASYRDWLTQMEAELQDSEKAMYDDHASATKRFERMASRALKRGGGTPDAKTKRYQEARNAHEAARGLVGRQGYAKAAARARAAAKDALYPSDAPSLRQSR
jgi:hypothetical protein